MGEMLCAAAIVAIVSGSVMAQGYDPINDPAYVPWPTNVGEPGPFRAAVGARLMGSERYDGLVIQGQMPVFLYEPVVFDSFENLLLARPTTDVAVLSLEK